MNFIVYSRVDGLSHFDLHPVADCLANGHSHADVQATSTPIPTRTPTATATPPAIPVTGDFKLYLPLIGK